MTLHDRLRQLVEALPSDHSSVTLTRGDLVGLLECDGGTAAQSSTRDLTVEEVAADFKRSPSTIRRWLIAGELRGYKLNGRDWRVPRSSLEEYRRGQQEPKDAETNGTPGEVDISAWRGIG